MDFDVQNYAVVSIGSLDIWITESLVVSWVIMAILVVFAIVVRIKLRSFKEIPAGFQNVIEAIIEAFDKFAVNSTGPKLSWIGGWFFTVFSFLMVANMSGLVVGVRPPTADWPVPLALALVTFFLLQFVGLRYRGWDYVKSYFEPVFVFFPINVLGELSRPVALSFRLFGNVLGGMILLSLIYGLAPLALQIVLPFALHIYFDIFAGALQAFIFTVLSLTYLGLASTHSSENQ